MPEALRPSESSRPPGHEVASRLLEQASAELRACGRGDHDVTLERALAYFADPDTLRCTFWCETCHVEQALLLPIRPD